MKKDFSGLKRLQEQLAGIETEKERFMAQTAAGVAAIFLREVKKRTPVGKGTFEAVGVYRRGKKKGQAKLKRVSQGGTLRRGWYAGHVERRGRMYVTSVRNPVRYAPYVEYGHRQHPGQFVPALGKRLKKSWVEGQFMMTKSGPATEAARRDYTRKRFRSFMEGGVNGGK